MNITKYEFSTEDLAFNAFEKIAIIVLCLMIQIPGNIMLFGIIQYDRHGGDPLKRRIQDQVRFKEIKSQLIISIILFGKYMFIF